MRRNVPPPIKRVIEDPEFAQDVSHANMIVDEMMIKAYVTIMFVSSLTLAITVMV